MAAVAVAADDHLVRCMTYIELNMVRAVAVKHPSEWQESGYAELFSPPQRYGLVERNALMERLGIGTLEQLRTERRNWTDAALDSGASTRDERWNESIAVGDSAFAEEIRAALDLDVRSPRIRESGGTYILLEGVEA